MNSIGTQGDDRSMRIWRAGTWEAHARVTAPFEKVRAAPLVRVKAKITVKNAVYEYSSATAYGEVDRDFPLTLPSGLH